MEYSRRINIRSALVSIPKISHKIQASFFAQVPDWFLCILFAMKDILKGQKQFSSGDHAGKSNKSLCISVGLKIASGLDENVIHFSFGEQNWIFTHRFSSIVEMQKSSK